MGNYPAIVEWDEHAGAYGAVFPDLDIGVVGSTLQEVLDNAKEMLRDYVMEMAKRGWPVSAPSSSEQVEVPEGNTLVLIPVTLPSTLASD
jgi:predicted RNase H-like HicB family nuclease